LILYDCEIKNAIEPNIMSRGDVFHYCNGWTDYVGMGISCVCAYDYRTQEYRVFLEDNMDEFSELITKRNFVVGFNNKTFDDELIRAHGIDLPETKSQDILRLIWEANGLGPKFERRTHGGYSLDGIIKKNFPGQGKTLDGAKVAMYWQVGRKGKIIDYCLNDVKMLKLLVDKMITGNVLINPKNNKEFKIPSFLNFEV